MGDTDRVEWVSSGQSRVGDAGGRHLQAGAAGGSWGQGIAPAEPRVPARSSLPGMGLLHLPLTPAFPGRELRGMGPGTSSPLTPTLSSYHCPGANRITLQG